MSDDPTSPDNRARFLALCEEATPGPWVMHYCHISSGPVLEEYKAAEFGDAELSDEEWDKLDRRVHVADMPRAEGDTPDVQGKLDGEYITEWSSPDVCRAYVAAAEERDELRKQVERYEAMRCEVLKEATAYEEQAEHDARLGIPGRTLTDLVESLRETCGWKRTGE